MVAPVMSLAAVQAMSVQDRINMPRVKSDGNWDENTPGVGAVRACTRCQCFSLFGPGLLRARCTACRGGQAGGAAPRGGVADTFANAVDQTEQVREGVREHDKAERERHFTAFEKALQQQRQASWFWWALRLLGVPDRPLPPAAPVPAAERPPPAPAPASLGWNPWPFVGTCACVCVLAVCAVACLHVC